MTKPDRTFRTKFPLMKAIGSGMKVDDRGSSIIETAAAFMISMTMVLVIIECSMMVYTYGVVAEAARHGVRYATIHGTDSTICSGPNTGCSDTAGTNVVNDVKTFAANFTHNVSAMTVLVNYPESTGSTPSSLVTVAITYAYVPIFKLPVTGATFHTTAEGRILY